MVDVGAREAGEAALYMAKQAAQARLGSACIGPAMLAGRVVPTHVPPYRPRAGLGMAYAGCADPTACVLGGPGRPLAH
jgi:hypothetical protein